MIPIYFKRVVFESDSEATAYGSQIKQYCQDHGIEIAAKKQKLIDVTAAQLYRQGKETLMVGKRKVSEFQTCKPSADYQLPLFSGCLGMCEYCYLHTRTKTAPVQRISVNLQDILLKAESYAQQNTRPTVFELAASSDPLVFEPLCSLLCDCIAYFGTKENMRLRISTKFTFVQSLLSAEHKGNTEVRFSVNTPYICSTFEHNVPSVEDRLNAAAALSRAGYPVGFMIAPIFLYESWQADYAELLQLIHDSFRGAQHPTFEVITHRYTLGAKESILQIFPNTQLDMSEETRNYKHGQFGYGKYVYPKDQMGEVKAFFQAEIARLFGAEQLLYCI